MRSIIQRGRRSSEQVEGNAPRRRHMPGRRLRKALTTATAVASAAALSTVLFASPASAGLVDGDITNRLSSAFTVKIADFGTGGQPGCSTWNAGWNSCTHYWLPSGKADGQIGLGTNFDTDGFMVENSRYLVVAPNTSIWVAAGRWTKISDFSNVNCDESSSGGATCTVDMPLPSS